ncbi:hypothetical protein AB4156_07385 [Cupriavidus sp. 2MCAB6]|uniref:hypothetical protein n=1 Tax=Cupriavidus sp. 2MCAB6 TaxID=3232981 RepID=UPI003F9350A6
MPRSYVNPLSGKPQTRESAGPDGSPIFAITVRELTPLRAKALDFVNTCLGTFAGLYGVLVSLSLPISLTLFVILGALWAVYEVCALGVKKLLQRTTRVQMTRDSISVRRWYGWQCYDRNIEHRFALQIHDRAQAEQEQLEFETRQEAARGQIVKKTAYYNESFHVVLVHAGHRVDLLTVYGRQESTAIVARLQYCDRRLNEAAKMGGGINQHPEDEWEDAPGGLGDV